MHKLSGKTLLYPIIGDPIYQVKSPENLTKLFHQKGKDAIVPPMHVRATELYQTVEVLKCSQSVGGIVVTIPHKIQVLAYCDVLSKRAAFVGSVNVVFKRQDGTLYGDNVDGLGYLDGLKKEGFDISGKRALLIGVGGAGSAVAFEILHRGASYLAIHDVDETRRDIIIKQLDNAFPGRVGAGSFDPSGFDLVANVTPVGMKEGDPYPVDVERLEASQFVADSITKPDVSPLVQYARELGCNTMIGAGMFHAEAEILVNTLLGNIDLNN